MNPSKPKAPYLMVAAALAALSMLAACDQVVSSANAQTPAITVSSDVVYVGDEYAVVQAQLGAKATPSQAPTF